MITFDFETYSECNLLKSGAYAYSQHATTQVLCLAWAVNEESVNLWVPGDRLPHRLLKLVADGAKLSAWNSFFEMCIWINVLRWPKPKITQWRDTAALAAAQAYPRSLAKCGEALGLAPDELKNKRGKLLIQRLCKPYRGQKLEDSVMLQELYQYCIQDVVAERSIRNRLRELNSSELDVFLLDQKINWRGIALDKRSIQNALEIIKKHASDLNKEVSRLTNGELDSTASRAKSLRWINQSYQLGEYDKAAISKALADPNCPDDTKKFLLIRQSLSKSSTKKYNAMLECIADDNRVHGSLMYHGSSTGRWAGKHVQPHNLPRPTVKDVDSVIAQMAHRDPRAIVGEPMECLSSCLRGMLIASPGNRLMAADYSSIEARVLAWLCDHKTVLNTFVSGKDLYVSTASEMFKCDYADVTSHQRFIGKVATLSLGYQGGARAFIKMSEAYGADIDEREALKIRDNWRKANKPIVKMWANVGRAAKSAISYKTQNFNACMCTFAFKKGDLLCKLPSKRIISFPQANLINGKYDTEITFSGVDSHTHRWTRLKTYGGSIVQSITQAVARDILAEALLRLEKAKYSVVLHVHDEIVADVPKEFGTLKEFEKLMCALPGWAVGLPVAADGYESYRYRK